MRQTAISVLAFALFALCAPTALASREPTLKERAQITNSYPAGIRDAPVECVWLNIRVSSRNARYALVVVEVINWRKQRCSRYLHNGFDILKRSGRRWTRIYSGSDWPPCSLRIPLDLVRCGRR